MIMPSRFGLTYVDQGGKEQTPYMIHRAIIGSERFIAILIEHFGGAFRFGFSGTGGYFADYRQTAGLCP